MPGGERCECDGHPDGDEDEGPAGTERGPEQAGAEACGEVSEALHGGKQPERGAADVGGCLSGDGSVFGGFGAADADAGEDEPGGQSRPVGRVSSEAEVGGYERADADREHTDGVGAA